LVCSTFACRPAEPSPNPAEAADRIRTAYETRLFQLSPRIQSHFAVRLYRVTGDPKYLNAIAFQSLILRHSFLKAIEQLDANHLEPAEFQDGDSEDSDKSISAKIVKRREIMKDFQEFLYPKKLLFLVYQLSYLGMQEGSLAVPFEKALDYLREVPFERFLLNEEVLRYNSAQAVNAIYYLKILGIRDFEQEAAALFQKILAEELNAETDPVSFENKIYGLTHFMIAASNYYQEFVSAKQFEWILDYFRENLAAILNNTKPDVIAEVGLCFKLAGLSKNPAVEKVQKSILSFIDPNTGVIPPSYKEFDWQGSEHRNVVAFLLLTDFDRFFPGPKLHEFSQLKYLPE